MVSWETEKSLVWDATCSDTSYTSIAANEAGTVAAQAEERTFIHGSINRTVNILAILNNVNRDVY